MNVIGSICVCDALRDLVPFVQFKKRENTLGGMLLLKKLQALADLVHLYNLK